MATRTILSWEEFLAAGKEGHKSEWVDGVIIMMSPVRFLNAAILVRLMACLVTFCDAHPEWLWLPSNAVFTMASGNWRCPDASLFRKERFPGGEAPPTKAGFAPDVAFEILSPSDTPSILQRKRQDYQESGVIQVWIDPEQRLIELVEPDRPLRFFKPPQALVIGSLPSFRVELEKLFAA
jgi:Uma2 family endonuclease